jgi:hypothetical protein
MKRTDMPLAWVQELQGNSLVQVGAFLFAVVALLVTFGCATPPPATLVVDVQGQGSVDPTGGQYAPGSEVTLTATPETGWQFDHWEGDGLTGSQANPTTVTMDSDATITAVFAEAQYTLTVTEEGQGQVTSDPSGGTYDVGTSVQLTAVAAEGWRFDHWKGHLSGSDSPATVVVDQNKSVTAVFLQKSATPTFDPNGGTFETLPVSVAISCSTASATIRYTTDGLDPTPYYGTQYQGSEIELRETTTVKAIAYKDGMAQSEVASATFTFASAWQTVNSPTSEPLYDIWGSGAADVFAVGYRGSIAHFDGSSWTSMDSGTLRALSAVWGSGPNNVFAVGSGGTILHYAGTDWSPMDSGTTWDLTDVWGSGPNDIFVVGGYYYAPPVDDFDSLVLHYDGTSWTPMDSGASLILNCVWGAGPDTVFVGGSINVILLYNGATWKKTSSEAITPAAIWGSAADDVYAVGHHCAIEHYDGSGWTQISQGVTGGFNDVWGSGPNDVYTVGHTCTIMHFDGAQWQEMVSPTAAELEGVWGSGPNDVHAVGAAGTILRYQP